MHHAVLNADYHDSEIAGIIYSGTNVRTFSSTPITPFQIDVVDSNYLQAVLCSNYFDIEYHMHIYLGETIFDIQILCSIVEGCSKNIKNLILLFLI